jgi:serine/threonine protein kinase
MDQHIEAGVRIGDFKIVKPLGAGGMGIVCLANQISVNRLVALKVLGPTIDDPRARARFRREAYAVAMLKHPGIAAVHYAGQDGSLCYMATEYIDGPTLRQVFNRLAAARTCLHTLDSFVQQEHENRDERREIRFDVASDEADEPLMLDENGSGKAVLLTPEAEQIIGSKDYIRRCCEIIRDGALALEHAHTKGVVHRDIKPENLMLDRQGDVHIIDFGVARFRDDVSLSQTGALVGTPMYMSPEHISGRINVDHRSDIFSLGIVLYEALSLRSPYTAETREGIFRQIVSKALPPISWSNRAVSKELEAVLHKAIAKDPEDRYATAESYANDLQNVIDGRPIAANPYRYKFDKHSIAASRSVLVTIHAFFYLCMFLGTLLSVVLMLPDVRGFYILPGSIISLLACSYLGMIFYGLLYGYRYSVILATLNNIPLIGAVFFDLYRRPMYYFSRFNSDTFFLFFILGACVFSIIALNRPSTWRWVRYAEQLRSEHRQSARSR